MVLMVSLLMLLCAGFPLRAQDTLRVTVTYVSSGSIYIDAGSGRGVSAGDTLLWPEGRPGGRRAVVTATSSRSAAAHPLSASDTARQGDRGIVLIQSRKVEAASASPVGSTSAAKPDSRGQAAVPARPAARGGSLPFRGRIAVQYSGAGIEGVPQKFSTTSLVFLVQADQLAGSGLTLSLNGRASYDAGPTMFATGSKYQLRLYEASLGYDRKDAWYGWTLGRVFSRFVGGLGPVDGVQTYVRSGGLSAGVLAGWQPDWTTSGLDTREQKGAAFVNFSTGKDNTGWDVSAAYAGQWHEGMLDRDFLYLQNTLRLFQSTYIYQSSEIDLHEVNNGVRAGTFRVSNTYVTVSTYPLSWLDASLGYDATRPIYLFESMRWLPDSLLDFSIRSGYRASLGFRLPLGLRVNTWGRYAPGAGGERNSAMIGSGIRAADILHSGVSAGVQYTSARTVYTDGRTLSADLDDWLFSTASVQVHAERTWYTTRYWEGLRTATTLTGSLNLNLWSRWYAMGSWEQVWEEQGNTRRIFLELGVRF